MFGWSGVLVICFCSFERRNENWISYISLYFVLLFGCWMSHALTLASWEEGVTTGRKNFSVIEIFSSWLLKCSAFSFHLGGHSWLTFPNRPVDSFLWKVRECEIHQMQAWQNIFYVAPGHHFPHLIGHCDQFAPCSIIQRQWTQAKSQIFWWDVFFWKEPVETKLIGL